MRRVTVFTDPNLTYFGPGEPGSPESIHFVALALCGEAGELANLVKKEWRGDEGATTTSQAIREELADIMIYASLLAGFLNAALPAEVERKVKIVVERQAKSPPMRYWGWSHGRINPYYPNFCGHMEDPRHLAVQAIRPAPLTEAVCPYRILGQWEELSAQEYEAARKG